MDPTVTYSNYQPRQPTVDNSAYISYKESYPEDRISQWIYCYWELKSVQNLDLPYDYRVVADGCIDVLWDVNDPTQLFVVGFSDKHQSFSVGCHFHYRGIRYLPSSFPVLYGINATDLSNKIQPLLGIAPNLEQELRRLLIDQSWEVTSEVLEAYFGTQLKSRLPQLDQRIIHALYLIFHFRGNINLQSDLKEVGLSPRQLRRLFNYYIGVPPKVLCKVVRFQSMLNQENSTQLLRHEKAYYDAGYFDQAHFIKEFKQMYGQSPAQALRSDVGTDFHN